MDAAVQASPCEGWAFAPAVAYPVGSYPFSVAVGDFDGDGKQDLAVVNGGDDTVGVLSGRGDGTFGAQATHPVGTEPTAVAVGDFDGDGKPDVAVVNGIVSGVAPTSGPTLGVLRNQGGGGFAAQVTYAVGASFYSDPRGVVVGDVDGDGRPDVAVLNQGDGSVSVLLNQGHGTFGAQVAYPVGPGPASIAFGRFTASATLDIAATNFDLGPDGAPNTVSVLLNQGTGAYSPQVTYPADDDPGGSPYGVATADLDGDGKEDLIVSNFLDDTVSILAGRQDGTFGAPVAYPSGTHPGSVAVGDCNGDGRPDVLVLNGADKTLGVLLGQASGQLASQVTYPAGDDPEGVAVGDFNGDGHPDVAVADHGSNDVRVFLSVCTGIADAASGG